MIARKTIADASPWLGAKVELLPVSEIATDLRYQRTVRDARVRRIISDFNASAFGVVLCVLRNDMTWHCIDGQNRLEVCRRQGWEQVPALIITADGVPSEARTYLDANNRDAITALDRHRAAVVALDPVALALNAAVDAAGLLIGARPRDYEDGNAHRYVSAVTKLYVLAARYSPEHLTRTLIIMRDAWHGESWSPKLMHACAQVLSTFTIEGVDDAAIARRLGARTLLTITAYAEQTARRTPSVDDFAVALVKAFNATAGPKWNADALNGAREGEGTDD